MSETIASMEELSEVTWPEFTDSLIKNGKTLASLHGIENFQEIGQTVRVITIKNKDGALIRSAPFIMGIS